MLLRAFAIWLVIAAAEVAQGILRVRLLNRRVGDHRARQIGVATGCGLILAITSLAAPWIGGRTTVDWLGVGALWLGLMLAFDLAFGRWVFRAPWSRIAAGFDVRRGGLLGLGMAFLFAAPLLVARWRGLL
jgi:hypothetical protein